MKIVPSTFASVIYNFFVYLAELHLRGRSASWVNRAKAFVFSKFTGPVATKIHGYPVVVNFGYAYPFFARMFRSYNNPLVELVNQAYQAYKKPVTVIDIGAAIGDTVLLVESNCPDMVRQYYCVDGDAEFHAYLVANMGGMEKVESFLALLSDAEGSAKELVRTHLGTASAQGKSMVPSVSLDNLLSEHLDAGIDVLKVDVDGFDGMVLKGSKTILRVCKPAVIFEWHPILCQQTGNNWNDHFETLEECGYDRFVWFTKFGEFSHFMHRYEKEVIDKMAQISLSNLHCYDWHYDVVALHRDSLISDVSLAALSFAKARQSHY